MFQQSSMASNSQASLITHSAVEQASGLSGLVGIPAAFSLLNDPGGEEALIGFYGPYLRLAREARTGLLLEAPSARATAAWGRTWGARDFSALNRQAVSFVTLLRDYFDPAASYVRIAGALGPVSPNVHSALSPEAALLAHFEQAECLAAAGVDLLVGSAIPTAAEAIGLTMTAAAVECPLLVYLACDGTGLLRDGQSLAAAIAEIDAAFPEALRPFGYGITCGSHRMARTILNGLGSQAARVRAVKLTSPLFQPAVQRGTCSEVTEQGLPFCVSGADLRADFPQIAVFGGAFLKERVTPDRPRLPCLAA